LRDDEIDKLTNFLIHSVSSCFQSSLQISRSKRDSSNFKTFATNLIEFLNRLICDHLFLIEIPEFEKPVLYRVDYFGDLLE
jgi:hypothetical protein